MVNKSQRSLERRTTRSEPLQFGTAIGGVVSARMTSSLGSFPSEAEFGCDQPIRYRGQLPQLRDFARQLLRKLDNNILARRDEVPKRAARLLRRLLAQITAIEMQQVEDHEHQQCRPRHNNRTLRAEKRRGLSSARTTISPSMTRERSEMRGESAGKWSRWSMALARGRPRTARQSGS